MPSQRVSPLQSARFGVFEVSDLSGPVRGVFVTKPESGITHSWLLVFPRGFPARGQEPDTACYSRRSRVDNRLCSALGSKEPLTDEARI